MRQGEVYLVGVLEGCYKIGRAADAEKRLLSFSPKLPVSLTILHRISTDDPPWFEAVLHIAFKHRRTLGEWFRLTKQDVALFRSIVAVRRIDQLPPELLSLWEQNGGDAAMIIRPDPVPFTQARTSDTAPEAEPAGELIAVTIGNVHYDSEGAIEAGEVYTVRSGVFPKEGDFVLTDWKGWWSLRQAKKVRGRSYAELQDLNSSSYLPIYTLEPHPERPRFVGILEGWSFVEVESSAGRATGFLKMASSFGPPPPFPPS